MNNAFFTKKITPVIVIILCYILYLSGYFQMTIATLLIFLASAIEYRKKLFNSLGFQRKKGHLKSLLIIAPILGTICFLFYQYLMVPSIIYLTGEPIDFSVFKPYAGNLTATLNLLVYILISAAFSEEIVFRGYLMQQFTKFFGSSNISLAINILLFGFLFGYSHAYQGISGQIASGITGMLFALIFHIRKNDLWFNIAIHGFMDIVALLFIYKGWI